MRNSARSQPFVLDHAFQPLHRHSVLSSAMLDLWPVYGRPGAGSTRGILCAGAVAFGAGVIDLCAPCLSGWLPFSQSFFHHRLLVLFL